MFAANRGLMRAQEPPFERSRCPVAGGQQIVTYIGFFMNYFMNVAKTVQAIVFLPSICANLAIRFNGLFNGILQALCGGIWNLSKPNPSDSRTIQIELQSQPAPLLPLHDPVSQVFCLRCTIHRPPQCPKAGPVLVGPLLGGVYATIYNSQNGGHVGIPKHSPHISDW